MPAIVKKSEHSINHGNAIVSKHVKSYEYDSYFVKKTEKAVDIIKKFGLPDFNKK